MPQPHARGGQKESAESDQKLADAHRNIRQAVDVSEQLTRLSLCNTPKPMLALSVSDMSMRGCHDFTTEVQMAVMAISCIMALLVKCLPVDLWSRHLAVQGTTSAE